MLSDLDSRKSVRAEKPIEDAEPIQPTMPKPPPTPKKVNKMLNAKCFSFINCQVYKLFKISMKMGGSSILFQSLIIYLVF